MWGNIMYYEAPDFIKIVANISGSFSGSQQEKCTQSVGIPWVEGEPVGEGSDIICDTLRQWSTTTMNCWIGNVE